MKKIILIGLIIICLFLVGCYSGDNYDEDYEEETYEDTVMDIRIQILEELQNKTEEIQEHCMSIIPNRIPLTSVHNIPSDRDIYWPWPEDSYWKDGTKMSRGTNDYDYITFVKGSNRGENINYIYPLEIMGYDGPVTSSEGTITEVIRYDIQLGLDPQDNYRGYKVVEYRCSVRSNDYPNYILTIPYRPFNPLPPKPAYLK